MFLFFMNSHEPLTLRTIITHCTLDNCKTLSFCNYKIYLSYIYVKKDGDNRIRTCAGMPSRFQVDHLNHSVISPMSVTAGFEPASAMHIYLAGKHLNRSVMSPKWNRLVYITY